MMLTRNEQLVAIVVVAFVVLPAVLTSPSVGNSLFWSQVDSGSVGICYHFGALVNETYPPGLFWKMPWPLTSCSQVNIRPQTDREENVNCGTSDGINVRFDTIEVGNTLSEESVAETIRRYGEDYDRYLIHNQVRHEMQQICTNLTCDEVYKTRFDEIDDRLQAYLSAVNLAAKTGVRIDFVRLTKPVVPPAIRENMERIAQEKSLVLLRQEEQRRVLEEGRLEQARESAKQDLRLFVIAREAAANKSKAEAVRDLDMLQIKSEADLADERLTRANARLWKEKEIQANISAKESAILLERAEVDTRIRLLNMTREAQGLSLYYNISGYKDVLLANAWAQAIGSNSKMMFGTDLPTMMPFLSAPLSLSLDH